MKPIMLILISFAFVACSDDSSNDFIVSGTGDVSYTVTLNASWSSTTHPQNFPAKAHFSNLVGATHNVNTVFWQAGDIATAGIEQMAETGKTTLLINEINTDKIAGNSDNLIHGDGIDKSPGSRTFTLPVKASHPYLTLVTMIAPSPDWFIGVNAYDLMPNGNWVNNATVTLYAYDAGTDNGSTYTSANADTSPQDVITQIIDAPFLVNTNIIPVAELVINRQL